MWTKGRYPAHVGLRRLTRLLVGFMAAAWVAGLLMPATAHAQESSEKVTVGVYINDIQ